MSATSRTFALAIAQFPGYLVVKFTKRSGANDLAERAALVTQQICAVPHRVVPVHVSAVLLRIGAVFALFAVLFFGPLASDAQAHGLHAGLSVQTAANWEQSAGSKSGADVQRATAADCGVNCCSATSCAVAFPNVAYSDITVVSADTRFALQGNALSRSSPQTALKRPPKA